MWRLLRGHPLLPVIGLGVLVVAGSALLLLGTRLQVTASLEPQLVGPHDYFTVHVELRNTGLMPVSLKESTCEPLQIRISDATNRTVWVNRGSCPFTWVPGVVQLQPGQSLQRTECLHYVASPWSCTGYDPALSPGRYKITGTFYGQPIPGLDFQVVDRNA